MDPREPFSTATAVRFEVSMVEQTDGRNIGGTPSTLHLHPNSNSPIRPSSKFYSPTAAMTPPPQLPRRSRTPSNVSKTGHPAGTTYRQRFFKTAIRGTAPTSVAWGLLKLPPKPSQLFCSTGYRHREISAHALFRMNCSQVVVGLAKFSASTRAALLPSTTHRSLFH